MLVESNRNKEEEQHIYCTLLLLSFSTEYRSVYLATLHYIVEFEQGRDK
jgi:hypothetical protein